MAVLQEAQALAEKFKGAYHKNDVASATDLLSQLKLKLIELPSLPPVSQPSATAQQELTLAREVLEHAALLSIKQKDEAAMERAFAQLKTFYADTRSQLPPSSEEASLLGLDLLRLLVQNRIAEFHTALELIEPEAQSAAFIKHAIQLEQWLMEGAYNKVLGANKQPPSEFHALLMDQLTSTIRDEIASCSEKAYSRLKVSDAQRLMMFGSEQAVLEYAQQHGWSVEGGYINFKQAAATAATKEVPSLTLINNALVYAKELERIV